MQHDWPGSETPRLILRPPLLVDFPSWAAFKANEEVNRFIGGTQTPQVAWQGMAAMAGSWLLKGFGMFSVIERVTGQWIGRIGPYQPEGHPGPEIGYGLIRDAWGQGFGYEGASAAIDWVITTLGWSEFIHIINPDNIASAALARKLGSVRLDVVKLPPPFDNDNLEVWGQNAASWRTKRMLHKS